MSLLIADKAVDLAGTPLAGRPVTVAYSGLDPFALQSGTWRVGEQGRVTTTTQADGTFDLALLWPSEMQPSTGISVIITLPDGVQYAGVVPDGVTGPLTVYQLVTGYSGAPYSWGKVTGAGAAQVQVIGGGLANPMQAKGDLIAAAALGAPTRLPAGPDGSVLVTDATQALGMRWSADLLTLEGFVAPTLFPFAAAQKAQTLGAFFQWL